MLMISIVADVIRNHSGEPIVFRTAVVPVGWLRGTFPMKDLIEPTQLAALARLANKMEGKRPRGSR